MLSSEQKLLLIEYIDSAEDFKKNGNFEGAIDCYEKVLSVDSEIAAVYPILADLYHKAYGNLSLDRQIYCYEKFLKLKPDSTLALHGLAFSYEKIGDFARAKKYYQTLIDTAPTDIDYYNYGCFLIHCGDFLRGHEYFTRRFEINDPNLRYPVKIEGDRRWDFKTDLSDKTLLVHYEQGFGDTIMYCRFLPQLAKIVSKVIFAVQGELFTLLDGVFEGVELVTEGTIPDYDYSMALLDAPYALKTTIDNIPLAEGYLGKNIAASRCQNFRIGISYSGDKSANYNGRDLSLNWFEPLVREFREAEFYSLQKEERGIVDGIAPLGGTFSDFKDTADAIKSMDLIISTDNVILNLAGALGVKTIGLFNKETNFRWYKTEGSNVGWYKLVKPLQCKTFDDWNGLFLELEKIIRMELTMHA